jgi:hypothetical protein
MELVAVSGFQIFQVSRFWFPGVGEAVPRFGIPTARIEIPIFRNLDSGSGFGERDRRRKFDSLVLGTASGQPLIPGPCCMHAPPIN